MLCCGFEMMERKDFDGRPIFWCVSCGRKKARQEGFEE